MGIISEKDFLSRLKNLNELSFKPGEKSDLTHMDTHDFRYVESGDFCANLHIHTHHSDGIMTVEELRQRAKEIPNMLVAITDHDTLDGAKEAYKICNDIDICLGIEISTVGIKFPKQPIPLSIHLLVYCIDPFDKDLNDFIDEKKYLKLELAKQTIKELNEALPEYNFNLEEASKCHPLITKGQDEVAYPLKKYTTGKILQKYFCPDATFSYEEPIYKYKHLFYADDAYYLSYKRALSKFLNSPLPLISDEIFEKLQTAREIYSKAHPQINKMLKQFSSFEDTVKFISSLKSGIMSIAHPARIKAYRPDFYNYLFNNFKKSGENKALCWEKYYQSYEGSYYLEWCDIIERAAQGLIPTGGMDTHGKDITCRGTHY